MSVTVREELLDTERGRFGVRRLGEADRPLVVCVHGFPDDASTFDGLASSLVEADYDVAALYLRGYAPSPLTGSLALPDLVDDLLSVIDALSPELPVFFVGHDYGAQLGYAALQRAPERFAAAVTLAGAHPAYLTRNSRRHPKQLWMSRYIVFFQLGRLADSAVARDDFAYVDKLWRRWAANGWEAPAEHLRHVKQTLAASMPAPVAMYRGGGFNVEALPIDVPTLFIRGTDDGCALPQLSDGQEELFTSAYRAMLWSGIGHFPHLEDPERTADAVIAWFRAAATTKTAAS